MEITFSSSRFLKRANLFLMVNNHKAYNIYNKLLEKQQMCNDH